MSGPSPDIALNAEMARLHHAGGLTLAQIGARYSLSKSAVGCGGAAMTYPPLAAGVFGAINRPPLICEIQSRVERHYGLSHTEFISDRRDRYVARPRQVAMYLSKRLTKRSFSEIGRRFGDRDHTTVIHAIRQIEKLRQVDPELDADVRALERELSV